MLVTSMGFAGCLSGDEGPGEGDDAAPPANEGDQDQVPDEDAGDEDEGPGSDETRSEEDTEQPSDDGTGDAGEEPDGDTSTGPEYETLGVYLEDAPTDRFSEVWIDVASVTLRPTAGTDTPERELVVSESLDLMAYDTPEARAHLITTSVQAGTYDVALDVRDAWAITADTNERQPIGTSDAAQAGPVEVTTGEGGVGLTLDLDVDESLTPPAMAQGQNWRMEPKLTASTERVDQVSASDVTDPQPTARAPSQLSANTGQSVELDGSASQAPTNASLRYDWSIADAPPDATPQLSDRDADVASFEASTAGTYRVELTVMHGSLTDSTRVAIDVESGPSSGGGGGGTQTTRATFYVKDAPIDDFDELFVALEDVAIRHESQGWVSPRDASRTLNLLEFSAPDTRAALDDARVPVGSYDRVRVTLDRAWGTLSGFGQNTSIPLAEDTHEFDRSFTVDDTDDTRVLVDLSLRQSLQKLAAGNYELDPTIGNTQVERVEQDPLEDVRPSPAGDEIPEDQVQQGLNESALEDGNTIVLRGHVEENGGGPLSGVNVTVHGRSELGTATTNETGNFSMVVNKDDRYRVQYHHPDYIDVERRQTPTEGDYHWLPDVALTEEAPSSTLDIADGPAVYNSTNVSDTDGQRQLSMRFPQNTTVTCEMPDGSRVQVDNRR